MSVDFILQLPQRDVNRQLYRMISDLLPSNYHWGNGVLSLEQRSINRQFLEAILEIINDKGLNTDWGTGLLHIPEQRDINRQFYIKLLELSSDSGLDYGNAYFTVTESTDSNIQGVTVSLSTTESNSVISTSVTDENGLASFNHVPVGEYLLEIYESVNSSKIMYSDNITISKTDLRTTIKITDYINTYFHANDLSGVDTTSMDIKLGLDKIASRTFPVSTDSVVTVALEKDRTYTYEIIRNGEIISDDEFAVVNETIHIYVLGKVHIFTIRDSNNQLLDNASIDLLPLGISGIYSGVTDFEGKASIQFKPGTYDVNINKAGYSSVTEHNVVFNNNVLEHEYRLDRVASIRLNVSDSTGETPLEHLTARVFAPDGTTLYQQGTTNSVGHVNLSQIPLGSVWLRIMDERFDLANPILLFEGYYDVQTDMTYDILLNGDHGALEASEVRLIFDDNVTDRTNPIVHFESESETILEATVTSNDMKLVIPNDNYYIEFLDGEEGIISCDIGVSDTGAVINFKSGAVPVSLFFREGTTKYIKDVPRIDVIKDDESFSGRFSLRNKNYISLTLIEGSYRIIAKADGYKEFDQSNIALHDGDMYYCQLEKE